MQLRKVLSFFFVLISGAAMAQDPQFTQFYANPLYLNPAFAGAQRCPRVCLNYRNQWPALTGTFVTYTASYDQHVDPIGGLGLLVLQDKAGESTLTTTNVSGIYSYQLNVTREFSIRLGLQGTYAQKRVDWNKLTFGDMIDPRYGFIYETQEQRPNETRNFWDFSSGIVAYSNRYYGGVAVHHMTEPQEFFITEAPGSKLPMKITAHAGAIIPIAGNRDGTTYISPNFLYQKQRDFQQYNVGFYIAKAPLVGGLWYRGSDSFIALVGLQQGIFKFGYSYDVTTSKLYNASAGSHEISLGLQFGCHPKKKRFRTIKCPAF
ncbi:MAG: type IX secretion system membrane protein PorP/SprF [Bacteroidota bacterium]|jgi:type IX secretion system PorP/SprF family membrane protein|nr:type IX secretion system membrane protein PorP/SprF [Bacteroidia bacterium]HPD54487.1 type IX secretion system membrane protein PorP/SprF [Bacteroidia bacterium]HRI42153.1 type IX secretion system membrane protein PorP/SprF [Bacteroidia bacterium]HRS39608.1 type IX secretion system membrane protein PorP/SprF [Bacteroidia bacterium]HRU62327.1 type IX secretion system membrane protein PorP/SprF [Bacteroidia bacterium]